MVALHNKNTLLEPEFTRERTQPFWKPVGIDGDVTEQSEDSMCVHKPLPRRLSRLTMCFSVSAAVMMRFTRGVVKMPSITSPSSATSSACSLLSAFCLCVWYCLSTCRVICSVRIYFFVFLEEFFIFYNSKSSLDFFFHFCKLRKVVF